MPPRSRSFSPTSSAPTVSRPTSIPSTVSSLTPILSSRLPRSWGRRRTSQRPTCERTRRPPVVDGKLAVDDDPSHPRREERRLLVRRAVCDRPLIEDDHIREVTPPQDAPLLQLERLGRQA